LGRVSSGFDLQEKSAVVNSKRNVMVFKWFIGLI